MAIEITEFKLPITPDDARGIIQQQTDSFGVFIDLDRLLEYEADYFLSMRGPLRNLRLMMGDPSFDTNQKKLMPIKFQKRFNLPEYKLQDKFGKVGFNENIINALMSDPSVGEDCKEALRLYKIVTKCKYMISYLGQYKGLPMSTALDYQNHRMTIGRPTWSLLSTSRISAKEPSIQNISRELPDLLTQPKGWVLKRADSGQIEPRINFSYFLRDDLIANLIIAYSDAYYGMLHYVMLSPEEERLLRSGFEANFVIHEITKDMEDKRQTIKTLTNAGSYGSTDLGKIDQTLAAAFDAKIVKHPARLALERKVREDVRRGVTTFYGAFGTPVTPEETETYKKTDKGWIEHLIRCGINNPVQTTASELMIHSVYEASKILRDYPNSHICYYKHDEACFYIHEDDMHVLDSALNDITAYKVKGWIPIEAEGFVGQKVNEKNPSVLI